MANKYKDLADGIYKEIQKKIEIWLNNEEFYDEIKTLDELLDKSEDEREYDDFFDNHPYLIISFCLYYDDSGNDCEIYQYVSPSNNTSEQILDFLCQSEIININCSETFCFDKQDIHVGYTYKTLESLILQ